MSRPPNEELKLTAQVPEAGSTRTLRLDGRA